MDNFVCVISNSVLIYNFHFPFPIVVVSKYQKSLQVLRVPNRFSGIRDWAFCRSEMRDYHYERHMRIGNFEGRDSGNNNLNAPRTGPSVDENL